MACVDDVVNFVDRSVQAVQDFVSDVGTQVGAALETVWKEVGAPILEYIFGLLGYGDETVYSVQVINQRLIEDDQPDQINLAIRGAIENNLDLIETLQHTILSGPVGNIGLYKNYGENNFIHGLPSTLSTAREIDLVALLASLKTDTGQTTAFLKESFLSYPKDEYYVKYILEKDEAYNEFDNIIIKGGTTWYFDFWTEDAITGDFTINLRMPNITPTSFTTLGYLIPPADYDLYYNVVYGLTGDVNNVNYHWLYKRSLGTYTGLDGGISEGDHVIAKVLPIVPLRRNFNSVNINVPRSTITGITLDSDGIITPQNTFTNISKAALAGNGKSIIYLYDTVGVGTGIQFSPRDIINPYDTETFQFLITTTTLSGYSAGGTQTSQSIIWGNNGEFLFIRWKDTGYAVQERIARIQVTAPYDLTTVNVNSGDPAIRRNYNNVNFGEQISFSKDGFIFIHQNDNGVFYSTILTTAWDLDTYGTTVSVSMLSVTGVSHLWQSSGTELYVFMDTSPDAFDVGIRIFTATTPYDITTTGIQNGIGGVTSAILSLSLDPALVNLTGFISEDESNYLSLITDSPTTINRGFQRYAKVPIIDPAYETSKNILKLVGLDINDIIDQIETNTDIANIEDAFILFTMNIYTQSQAGLKALFINFENLFVNSAVDQTSYLAAAGTADPNYNTVVIKEQNYNSTLVFNYITRIDVVGVVNPVGEYSSVITILPNDTYDPITNIGGGVQSYLLVRHQYSATNYFELKIHGLFLSINIFTTANVIKTTLIQLNTGVTAADITIQKNFSFPLPYLVLSDLDYREKVIIIYETLSLSIYATDSMHLEYYETAAFLSFVANVLTIIAVILLVFSWGSASSFSSALWALGQSLLIAYALNYVLKEILIKNRDDDTAKALAIAAAIAATYYAYNNNTSLSTAEVLLLAVSAGIQAVSIEIGLQTDDLQREIDAFTKSAEERQQEIDDAQDLLDNSKGLSVGEIAAYLPFNSYETPEQFFNRTIHNSNPGIDSLGQVSNYVKNLLELPELDNHTFDPSSPYN